MTTSDHVAPVTLLTPHAKTLVSIDVASAWEELPEGEFIRLVESVLPGDMTARVHRYRDGSLKFLGVQSVHPDGRRFRVIPGQELICDRDMRTAAALYRPDVDNLYHRQGVDL